MNGIARRNFAKRLKALRSLKYNTAAEFARVLEIEPQRYSKWEQGRAEPNIYFLLQICQLLDTNPTFLLLGHTPHPPSGTSSANQPQPQAIRRKRPA